ncbi:MAG: hypothetical protein FWE24_06085 [Defluviitaleaceae bacterium]|nr:hypothetical protein [Defluviitaleaceae bacterium]
MDDDKIKFDDMDDDLASILNDDEMAELLEGLGLNEEKQVEDEEILGEAELESVADDAVTESPDTDFDEFDIDNINLEDLDFDFGDDEDLDSDDAAVASEKLNDLDFNFNELGSGDNLQDFDSDFDEDEIEFIKDVSVYDTVERDDPFDKAQASENSDTVSEYERFVNGADNSQSDEDENDEELETGKRRLFKKLGAILPSFKGPSFAYVLMVFLLLTILVVGGAGFLILNTMHALAAGENELIRNVETPTELARQVANNSSSIFLSSTPVLFRMDIIEPVEIVVNEKVAEFRFRYNVVWDRYNIKVIDSNNKEYRLLPSSLVEDNFGRSLRFEPLDNGITGVVLSVEEISSGTVHEFPFRFDGRLRSMPVIHIGGRRILVENDYFTLDIQNAYFSNTTTNITFGLHRGGNGNLSFDEVHLDLGGRRLPARDLRFHRVDEETTIYNVEFPAANRVEGALGLILAGLHFHYEPNMIINIRELMRNRPYTEQMIMLGEHTLTLERMGRMGPIYVVVAHIIDADGQRVQGDFETVLTLRDSLGRMYQIEGDVISAPIGADILFDTRRIADIDEIEGLTIHELRLNSVQIRQGDLAANMDIDTRVAYRRALNDERFIAAAGEFLRADGAEQVELIFYYWFDSQFVAEFEIYARGEVRTYLVAGTFEGGVHIFERILL